MVSAMKALLPAIQASAAELPGLQTTSEPIGRVEDGYGLSGEQGTSDVRPWCWSAHPCEADRNYMTF